MSHHQNVGQNQNTQTDNKAFNYAAELKHWEQWCGNKSKLHL
jgi:hypothetical protein